MEELIGTKEEKSENSYEGIILMYDPKTECIYLNLEETDLSKISLDVSISLHGFFGRRGRRMRWKSEREIPWKKRKYSDSSN